MRFSICICLDYAGHSLSKKLGGQCFGAGFVIFQNSASLGLILGWGQVKCFPGSKMMI
jgi:hypothetical protein